MFKIIILSQIGADRYQKLIFEIVLLSPTPWSTVHCSSTAINAPVTSNMLPLKIFKEGQVNYYHSADNFGLQCNKMGLLLHKP